MARKVLYLLLGLVVLTVLGASGCSLFKGTKETKKAKETTDQETTAKGYKILYRKESNDVYSTATLGQQCWSFTLHEFTGAGIVNRDGKQNKSLKMEGYTMGRVSSKKYDNYYYISASSSPLREVMPGRATVHFDFPEQNLFSANFDKGKSTELRKASASQFAGDVLASEKNRYLAYVMTQKKNTSVFMQTCFDPSLADSDLIVRDLKSGEEKTALSGNYNRQLFNSFAQFSNQRDAFYTIAKNGEGYKFIKVDSLSGKVTDFSEVFPEFDWSKINWNDFFTKGISAQACFFLSPDEKQLLVYRSIPTKSNEACCIGGYNYKIWSIDIKENTMKVISEGPGMINGLSWNPNSQEFVFIILSSGGCYPAYMDSEIQKFDCDGKNKVVLITEKKSKINSLGYSPDEEEIAYGVYGMDFVGWIKSVNPETKKVKEIVNTQETEGSVNKEKPVILDFVDWVASE